MNTSLCCWIFWVIIVQKLDLMKNTLMKCLFTSSCRWLVAYKLDWQEPGGLLRPVSASGVPARRAVRHGRDESQRTSARPEGGRPGGQRFSLFPQIWEGVLCQRLQDDREQAATTHSVSDWWTPCLITMCTFLNKNTLGQRTEERKSGWPVSAEVSLSDLVASWRISDGRLQCCISVTLNVEADERATPVEWKNYKTGNAILCNWLRVLISTCMSQHSENLWDGFCFPASFWMTYWFSFRQSNYSMSLLCTSCSSVYTPYIWITALILSNFPRMNFFFFFKSTELFYTHTCTCEFISSRCWPWWVLLIAKSLTFQIQKCKIPKTLFICIIFKSPLARFLYSAATHF